MSGHPWNPLVRHALGAAIAAGLIVAISTCSAEAAPSPVAKTTTPDPRVGVLFAGNTPLHACTASVLDSPSRDLVVTAAHCLVGSGAGLSFAPGYRRGTTPEGIWPIRQIFLDPHWVSTQDPQYDYAIVRVGLRASSLLASRPLETVTGTGLQLAATPADGTSTRVVGYNAGAGDLPLACVAPKSTLNAYPAFACTGFKDGSSGSPWIVANTTVTGVIGGLDQGGCDASLSYSSPFGPATQALLQRAETTQTGDTAPQALTTGNCPITLANPAGN